LTIAGTEAFGKNSRDRNWFTKRGGTGSNYLGFAQMDMNLHKGKGIFKEESYIETIGKMIHGQISTPTSKGKINLAGLVQAVEQGQIKSGQDFEAYLRTYGRGNLDRLNPLNISTNDWHGLGPNSIGGGWSRVPGLSNALVGYIANPIPVTDTFERPAEEAVDFNKVFNLLSQDAQANSVQTKPIKTSGVLVYSVGGGGKVLKGSSTFADTRAHHGGKKDYTTQFGRVRDYDLGGTNVEGSNSPLRVAKPGQISYIGLRGGYGLVVELADSNGKPLARYAHLDSVPKGLKVGKSVTPGEVIGFEGTTSSSNGKLIRGAYGDHLHLEASPDYHTAWIKGTVTGTWQGGTTSAYQMGQAITPSMANRLFELVGNLSPTDRLKLEQEIRVYNSNLDKPRAPSQAGTPKPVETTLGQDKPTSKPKPKFQSGMPDNRRRFRENPQEILNGNTVPQVITPKDLYNSSEGLDLSPALREQLQKPLERKSTKSMSNSVSIVLPSTEVSGGHEDTVYQVKPKEVSVARVTGKVIEVYSPTQYVTDSMDRVDTIPHNETYNDTH
jgi:murein DD-endopeptidase MepM/ murein hydrolase activator NlpD